MVMWSRFERVSILTLGHNQGKFIVHGTNYTIFWHILQRGSYYSIAPNQLKKLMFLSDNLITQKIT